MVYSVCSIVVTGIAKDDDFTCDNIFPFPIIINNHDYIIIMLVCIHIVNCIPGALAIFTSAGCC